LEEADIFENKRGLIFIAENAAELVSSGEKADFYSHDLPEFLLKVKLLRLTSNDLNDCSQSSITTIK